MEGQMEFHTEVPGNLHSYSTVQAGIFCFNATMSTFLMGTTLSNTLINHCEEDKLQWGIWAAIKRQGKKKSLNMVL